MIKAKTEAIKYGTYRETYDPFADRINLVNFICVPTDEEFEAMVAHAYEHMTSAVVKTFLSKKTQLESFKINEETKTLITAITDDSFKAERENSQLSNQVS